MPKIQLYSIFLFNMLTATGTPAVIKYFFPVLLLTIFDIPQMYLVIFIDNLITGK